VLDRGMGEPIVQKLNDRQLRTCITARFSTDVLVPRLRIFTSKVLFGEVSGPVLGLCGDEISRSDIGKVENSVTSIRPRADRFPRGLGGPR
jgi:hypothetical protein